MIAKEVAKAVRTANDSSERSSGGRPGLGMDMGITMSGLLNAIDGVASQEGRVLIMTTNYPEKLDDALIRPGRVDMKIEFTLASKQQIRELFIRMYCVDSREAARMPTNLKQIMPDIMNAGLSGKPSAISDQNEGEKYQPQHCPARPLPPTPPRTPMTAIPSRPFSSGKTSSVPESSLSPQSQPSAELERMADMFAANLPEAKFSPAEVQGYLIMRKNDPWSALAQVNAWRDVELAKKSEKEKSQKSKDEDGQDKQGVTSNQSSTDEPVKIDQEETDKRDRDGEQPGSEPGLSSDSSNNDEEVEDMGTNPKALAPHIAESGYRALLGNTEGAAEGTEEDNSDVDADSDASSLASYTYSENGSEASECFSDRGRGCDEGDGFE